MKGSLILSAFWLTPIVALAEPAYPRPELSRPARGEEVWRPLGSEWEKGVDTSGDGRPNLWPEDEKLIAEGAKLWENVWHRQVVSLPENWDDRRVLLHCPGGGAIKGLSLNGTELTLPAQQSHPQGVEVSDALVPGADQEIMVAISPTSEISEGFWLEPVPDSRVIDVHVVGDPDAGSVMVYIEAELSGTALLSVKVCDQKSRTVAAGNVGLSYGGADSGLDQKVATALKLPLPNPHLWSEESRFLYTARVELKREGEKVDEVEAAFGIRSIGVVSADEGNHLYWNFGHLFPRVMVKIEAQNLTPDEILASGFDTVHLRRHTATPSFYQRCDEVGLMVWQDIAMGDERELIATVDRLRHHPSVVAWAPLKDAVPTTRWLAKYDQGRVSIGGAGAVQLLSKDQLVGTEPDPLGRASVLAVSAKADPKSVGAALKKARASLKSDLAGIHFELEGTIAASDRAAVRDLLAAFAKAAHPSQKP